LDLEGNALGQQKPLGAVVGFAAEEAHNGRLGNVSNVSVSSSRQPIVK
jgi:hypothetical protein